ncbi:hypothetical protein ACX80D_03420 [Arthrobacter sp. Sr24]
MTFTWDIRARVQFEGDAHVQEDTCGFNGASAWIIDGATSLLEPLNLPAASDPQWLAQQLSIILGQVSATPGSNGVRGLLAAALSAIDTAGAALVGAEKVRFPSAAISVAQLNSAGVEVASLADCTVVVRTHDGATHLVRAGDADAGIPKPPVIEPPVIEPGGTPTTAATRRELLKQDRELRNTPGRLWVARREPEAAAQAHVVQLSQPEIMVMASDGAWRAVELGLVSGPEEFLARTSTTVDALGLMHELRLHQGRIGEVADDATVLTLSPRP